MESFVSYRSFHEALKDLSREQYGNVMFAINEYALNENEIELSGIEKMAFILIKPQLDANMERQRNGRYGSMGGRPRKNDENKNPMGFENDENKNPMGFKNDENKNPNVNLNVNANANLNANGNANLNSDSPSAPPELTQSQAELSERVFEIYESEDLPRSKGGKIGFLMRDFKNGLVFLHKSAEYSHLHSDDIVSAVENYASALKNPGNYVTQRMDFYTFARSKLFYKMLPGIFENTDFAPFAGKGQENSASPPERHSQGHECPKCKAPALYWSNERNLFSCDKCGHFATFEEYEEWKRQKL